MRSDFFQVSSGSLAERTYSFFGLRDFLNNALAEKHISKDVYEKVTHLNAEKLLGL